MKKLFPLMLAYAFLTSQGWALSGGPVFAGGGTNTTIGTYAGVLTQGNNNSSGDSPTGLDASNSLGVFSLGIPQVGLGSGAFVYFTEGRTYAGTIVGVADPDFLTFKGLVKAQFNVNISAVTTGNTGSVTNVSFPAGYANGSIDCGIIPSPSASTISSTNLAIRIAGTAELSVQSANVNTGAPTGPISSLSLTVDGFKQSTTADVSADLSAFGISQTSTTGSTGP